MKLQAWWLFFLCGAGCSEFELSPIGEDVLVDDPVDTGLSSIPWEFGDPPSQTVVERVPPATEPIYIHSGLSLWSWSPGDDDPAEIGSFSGDMPISGGMTDIAIDDRGRMFGCSNTSLYRIDPQTAETQYIGDLDDALWGLTFVDDGRLIGSGSGIYVLDTEDGAFIDTLVAPSEQDQTSGDLVELPDGLLYWTTLSFTWDRDGLLVIDPDTGDILKREVTPTPGIWGIAYAEETLYGFDFAGNFIRLDPHGGGEIFDQAPTGWNGAATNPSLW